jgi:hypothetical protein
MTKVRFVAASLVAALAASPVILDACLFTCQALTAADQDRSEPSCHHATEDADLRVEAPATPCGHDHGPSPSTMTTEPRGADARVDVAFVIVDSLVLHDLTRFELRIADAILSDTPSGLGGSLPLRI